VSKKYSRWLLNVDVLYMNIYELVINSVVCEQFTEQSSVMLPRSRHYIHEYL